MIQLEDGKIYRLPNGKRNLVAIHIGDGEYFLYDSEYETRLPPRYKIDSDGRLINWFGDAPIFSVNELIDIGNNYQK
jgi:hypothetical protein